MVAEGKRLAQGLATEVLCAQGEQLILREGGSGLACSVYAVVAAAAAAAAAAAIAAAASTKLPACRPLVAEMVATGIITYGTKYVRKCKNRLRGHGNDQTILILPDIYGKYSDCLTRSTSYLLPCTYESTFCLVHALIANSDARASSRFRAYDKLYVGLERVHLGTLVLVSRVVPGGCLVRLKFLLIVAMCF